jgi:hypothetical protein
MVAREKFPGMINDRSGASMPVNILDPILEPLGLLEQDRNQGHGRDRYRDNRINNCKQGKI